MSESKSSLRSKPIRTNADARAYLRAFHADALYGLEEKDSYTVTDECKRCGGAGYFPTPQHGCCFECGGMPHRMRVTRRVTIKALAQKLARWDRAEDRRKGLADRQREESNRQREEFLAQHPGLGAALTSCNNPILESFGEQLYRRGSLSARQIEVAFQASERAKARAEESHVSAPDGRHEIDGRVVSVKWSESAYGETCRITVKVETPEGIWLANGTAPSALIRQVDDAEDLKGRRVVFTATLSRGREEHFAFFKRPTKARTEETQDV